MKFYVSLFFAATFFCTVCQAGEKAPVPLTEAEKAIAAGTQQFAFDLYRQLAAEAKADENLFFSPLGIHTVLAMTAVGAKAETREQMLGALHLESLNAAERSAYRGLLKSLTDRTTEVHVLKLANHLWLDKGYKIRASFFNSMRDDFHAGAKAVEFSNNPAAAVAVMNRWAEKQTHGLVKNLITPEDISENTRVVLTNTLYFSGQWGLPFGAKYTKEAVFRTPEPRENPPTIPLMAQEEFFLYYKGEAFQAMSLPYGDPWTGLCKEMIVLLPDELDGLPALEKQLTAEFFNKIVEKMEDEMVKVKLAKFKLEESYHLRGMLEKLGITDAFSAEKADLSGISDQSKLFISSVIQKTSLDVDEKGTTAAAMSVGWATDGIEDAPPEFFTDRPFIFAIYDRHTDTVLFLGRFVMP